jgi:hypothetical protein
MTIRSIVLKLSDGSLPTPGVLLAMSWVSAIGALLIVAAGYLAVREARLANPDRNATVWSVARPP